MNCPRQLYIDKQGGKDNVRFYQKESYMLSCSGFFQQMLEAEGYQEWKESQEWEAQPGGKYYVLRNDSSLIAIKLPNNTDIKGFHMTASHSDSPAFKVKEAPEMLVEKHYVKLNTEKYGGLVMFPWMDRPLSIAGKVMTKSDKWNGNS